MSAAKTPAYRKHGFTLCLLGVVLLAVFFPEPEVASGYLQTEWTTKLGVWIIFFLQGISLPGRELLAGYRPLRLQAFVLAWNFLIFPIVTILCLFGLARFMPADVALGFGLLSILPTTIASAVAFTSLAGGRTANALCATVLSNVCAVLIVPLWVAFYLKTGASVDLPLAPLLAKLALLIIFPMLLGQLLRLALTFKASLLNDEAWLSKGGEWASSMSKLTLWIRRITSAIILFIVYAAFAGSVGSGFFEVMSVSSLALLVLETTALMLLVSILVWRSANWLRLGHGERIAAFFCGSQKSLATGLPLATAIFAVLPATIEINGGAVLLPLIVYHPLQLVLAAIWAGR